MKLKLRKPQFLFCGWVPMFKCSLLTALLLCSCGSLFARPAALFYMTEKPDSIRSFLAHAAKIDLVVPTWYQVDEAGLVTGAPNPLVLEAAQRNHVPVMPILALFGKVPLHVLAGDIRAQDLMNEALVREARLHGYKGFQLDFENLAWTDRDGFTSLVKRTAEALHGAGFQISVATVPNAPGYPGSGGFAKWIYSDWRGGYDLAALAKIVDLVCLMTYDQHTLWTTPGPVDGWEWSMENLDYALKVVPKDKLSLGIPLYGYHWFAGAPIMDKVTGKETPNETAEYISAENALQLAETYKGKIEWDDVDRTSYFYFYRDQMREWIFFTDLRTFRERYQLVENRGLAGFCSWVLGEEDPEIWTLLPSHQQ